MKLLSWFERNTKANHPLNDDVPMVAIRCPNCGGKLGFASDVFRADGSLPANAPALGCGYCHTVTPRCVPLELYGDGTWG